MFNAIELGLNAIRDVEENAEDTIAAGAITGALFRSSTCMCLFSFCADKRSKTKKNYYRWNIRRSSRIWLCIIF